MRSCDKVIMESDYEELEVGVEEAEDVLLPVETGAPPRGSVLLCRAVDTVKDVVSL